VRTVIELSDIHLVDSQAVNEFLIVWLGWKNPMLVPAIVTNIPVYGEAFETDTDLTERTSYETVALPVAEILIPTVTQALIDRPIPAGALHMTDDSETHPVIWPPVFPNRASGVKSTWENRCPSKFTMPAPGAAFPICVVVINELS